MSQQYRCQDESGQISYHAVPCAEVRITVKTPGKVEIDSAALELYTPWIIGLLIFSVSCLAVAKILKNILESREKKGNWKSAVKGSPVAKSPFTKP